MSDPKKSTVDETTEFMHKMSSGSDFFAEMAMGFSWAAINQLLLAREKESAIRLAEKMMTAKQKKEFERQRSKLQIEVLPEEMVVSHFRKHVLENGRSKFIDSNCLYCVRR